MSTIAEEIQSRVLSTKVPVCLQAWDQGRERRDLYLCHLPNNLAIIVLRSSEIFGQNGETKSIRVFAAIPFRPEDKELQQWEAAGVSGCSRRDMGNIPQPTGSTIWTRHVVMASLRNKRSSYAIQLSKFTKFIGGKV